MSVNELIGTVEGTPEASGLRVDDLVYGCGVTGRDRHSGEYAPDLPGQADRALDTVDAQLRDLGGSLDEVARVSFFLREPGTIGQVNDVWTARFPDPANRPTYKFMRAPLHGPEELRLDYFAVLGAERESLYLPKVAHGNPIPLAVKIGRYLFTSRVLPFDPVTGDAGRDGAEQAAFAVRNTGTLLEQAGMSWADVTQGRAFVAEPDLDEVVRAEWLGRFEATTAAPLQVTRYRAGALSALLEIIAVQ